MQHGIVIELIPFLSSPSAVRSGHTTRAFSSRLPKVTEAMRVIQQSTRPWPHLATAGEVDADALAVLKRGKRLRVIGQPSVVGALRAAMAAIAPNTQVAWQIGPSEAPAQSGEALLCLEGPLWVDDAAEAAVAAKARVVVAGSGTHAVPPRGAWLTDAMAGDGRFMWFGSTLATLLAWAGADADAWRQGIQAGQGTSARPALFENPGWSLATALSLVPDAVPVLVATDPALEGVVRSLARGWAALVRGTPDRGELTARVGLTVLDGVAGDVDLFEAVHGGPSDRLPIFWGPPTAASETFQSWLTRHGRPFLSVRTQSVDARDVAELVAVAVHAGVGLAVLRLVDPLDEGAALAWRHALTLEAERAGVDEASPLA